MPSETPPATPVQTAATPYRGFAFPSGDFLNVWSAEHLSQLTRLAEMVDEFQLTENDDDTKWRVGKSDSYSATSRYSIFYRSTKSDFKFFVWKQ
jgi:hypothetical protein